MNKQPKGMRFVGTTTNPDVTLAHEVRCTICNSEIKRENWLYQDKGRMMCQQLDCQRREAYQLPIMLKDKTSGDVVRYMTPSDTLDAWKLYENSTITTLQILHTLYYNLWYHYGGIDLHKFNFKKNI